MDLLRAYETLGIEIGSPAAVCEKAYRKKRSFWHEDHNKEVGAREKFTEVRMAYDVLLKAKFPTADRVRKQQPEAKPAASRASPGPSAGHGHGRGPHHNGARPGSGATNGKHATGAPEQARWWHSDAPGNSPPDAKKITRTIKLTIEEAAWGAIVTLQGRIKATCEMCQGKRVAQARICSTCSGRGFMDTVRVEDDPDGRGRFPTYACGTCNGFGTIGMPCSACDGTGKSSASREYSVRVKVPPGVREGTELIIKAEPHVSDGAAGASEVSLRVEIKEHELFWFDVSGVLCCSVPVSMLQCIAQDSVDVPTLWGPRRFTVRPGIRLVDLKDAGFPNRNGQRQPLRVHVEVSEEQIAEPYLSTVRKALEEVRSMGMRGTKAERSWVSKVRRWNERCGATGSGEQESETAH